MPKSKYADRLPRAGKRLKRYDAGEPVRGSRSQVELAGTYSADQLEFLKAMQSFKERVHRFPTWSEVLAVLKALGYRKIADERP
jgi:hypothetical protein